MVSAASAVVRFPGNLWQVEDQAALRSLDSASVAPQLAILVLGKNDSGDGFGGAFVWDPGATANDNDTTVIRPYDRAPGQAGRWLFVGNLGSLGPKGDPGGNVLSVGPLSGASAQAIPAGTNLIQVTGTTSSGDVGAGRQFVYDAAVNGAYVAANPGYAFVDAAGRGFRKYGANALPAVSVTRYGVYPQATRTLNQTTLIQAAIDAISAAAASPTVLVFPRGDYNAQGVQHRANVILQAEDYRPNARCTEKVNFYLPTGATAGYQINAASINYFGVHGIYFHSSTAQGYGAVSINNAKWFSINGNKMTNQGEQALLIVAGAEAHVCDNICYDVLMYRTRSSYAGAFQIALTDSYFERNEVGCSVQFDGNTGLYNAAPYMAGCWFTGGGNNFCRANVYETSEIGCIEDSYLSRHIEDRFELNLAEGLISRDGQTYIAPFFRNNSWAGSGLYGDARMVGLNNGRARTQIVTPMFDPSGPYLVGGVVPQTLGFVDQIYDFDPIFSPQTYYSGPETWNLVTNDPELRWGLEKPRLVENGQNAVRNSVGAGTGGTGGLPDNWTSNGAFATAMSITGAGVEDGMRYVDVRFAGVAAATFADLFFELGIAGAAAAVGEVWTGSVFVRRVAGTAPAPMSMAVYERNPSSGVNIANTSTTFALSTQVGRKLSKCRVSCTSTIANVSRVIVGISLGGITNGAAYDFTLRVACPQLEKARAAGMPVVTQGLQVGLPRGMSIQTPATGFAVTIPDNTVHLALTPAGTLASGSVTMPAAPGDGQDVIITTSQTITALTVTANTGQTILSPPTTLVAGARAAFRYAVATAKWYPS